jgi:glutamate:GABA antiporter
MSNSSPVRKMSLATLVMITVVSVDSLRNLPATAIFGTHLIFFYVLAAIGFLLPTALASAELSSRFDASGGIYRWVSAAMGPGAGFFAIWLQWIENVIWYPTILSFIVGSLAYAINPHLLENRYFLVVTVLVLFWLATWINLKGMKLSAFFSNLCTIFGLFVPMAVIIILGAWWWLSGAPMAISFHHWHDLMPHLGHQTWVSLTGIILSFCGIEIVTVYARDVDQPQKNFPKALGYASLIIWLTLILGALSIAIVLPGDKINLISGIMQTFDLLFSKHHLSFLLPVFGLMLAFGALGGLSNWIIAPTKGLWVAACDGHMPMHFRQTNTDGAPTHMLLYQAVIVTLLSISFLCFDAVNQSYWFLTALAVQMYMMMYIMMFVALVILRKKQVGQPFFQIPGGNAVLYLIAVLGIVTSLATFFVAFIPPEQIHFTDNSLYHLALMIGIVLLSLPPLVLSRLKPEKSSE